MATSQGLLFSEALYSDSGVSSPKWARIGRILGQLSPRVRKQVQDNPDSVASRFKRIFCFEQSEVEHLPLVCFDPAGMRQDHCSP